MRHSSGRGFKVGRTTKAMELASVFLCGVFVRTHVCVRASVHVHTADLRPLLQAQADWPSERAGIDHLPLLRDLQLALGHQAPGHGPGGFHQRPPFASGEHSAGRLAGSAGRPRLAARQDVAYGGLQLRLQLVLLLLLLIMMLLAVVRRSSRWWHEPCAGKLGRWCCCGV